MRTSKFQQMSERQAQAVAATIAKHCHLSLNKLLPLVKADGVDVSRATLHRHLQLPEGSAWRTAHAGCRVVIFDRASGDFTVLTTPVSMAKVCSVLEPLMAPRALCAS